MKNCTHLKACLSKPHARPRTKGIDELPKLESTIRYLAELLLPLHDNCLVQRKVTGEEVESVGLVFQARQAWKCPEKIKSKFLFGRCELTIWEPGSRQVGGLRFRRVLAWRSIWTPHLWAENPKEARQHRARRSKQKDCFAWEEKWQLRVVFPLSGLAVDQATVDKNVT